MWLGYFVYFPFLIIYIILCRKVQVGATLTRALFDGSPHGLPTSIDVDEICFIAEKHRIISFSNLKKDLVLSNLQNMNSDIDKLSKIE